MTKFYERFSELCARKDVSHSRAAMDIGLSNAAASGWADGNKPRDTTLRKLAAYFNVPFEYLKGEEEQKENPTAQIGSEVDEVTMELLDIIQNGTDEDRQDLLEMYKLLKRREMR